MKSEYIDYLEKKDREFAEGVQEENARTSKFYADRMDNRPQHIIDEEKVERAIERMHRRGRFLHRTLHSTCEYFDRHIPAPSHRHL